MITDILWTLIAIQIAMGAYDTLIHHEMTERLAWRPSQKAELRLHAVRNALYGVVFLALGWSELHGAWAITAMLILAVEIVITLWDFVEEDLSRRLPPTERINHTLLTLNYGAILALLVPVLLDWSQRSSAIVVTHYGLWTALMTIAAIAVFVFALRDWAAANRSLRLGQEPAHGLTAAIGAHRRTVLVTGATGFVGSRLVAGLAADGHDVIALTRDKSKAAALATPHQVIDDLDQIPATAEIDVIVNLAGEPIADRPWTTKRRETILASRLRMTDDIVALCARLDRKPEVLISGSAVGWYGVREDELLDETAAPGTGFASEVCRQWEARAREAETHGVRVVLLRIGIVLGTEGGFLARLLMPFEFGLGAVLGSGRQWMSWITRDDLVRLIAHVIATPALAGPVNAVAPQPTRNADFMRSLAAALGRPLVLRAPAFALRPLGALADELLLGGQRVLPGSVLETGFAFRQPTLGPALLTIVGAQMALAEGAEGGVPCGGVAGGGH